MKRGTPKHPKVYDLCELLHCDRPTALGYLELLWHFSAEFAPQGDIGRFSDRRIEAAMDWEGKGKPSGKLVKCLVEAKWIDADALHRLLIHDWKDHADESVRRKLNRAGLDFLSPTDKVTGQYTVTDGQLPSSETEKVRLPLPLPLPEPGPMPEPDGGAPSRATPPAIPIRTAREAGLLSPAGPAPAEDPPPRDGAREYLDAHPAKVNQDEGCRAYLAVIKTGRQHAELIEGIERHMASALWRDQGGQLDLVQVAKFYPPDRFVYRGTYKDHPPPWQAKSRDSPEARRRTAMELAMARAELEDACESQENKPLH